jgi:GNAT superfamily N-acetyltransferase
MLQIRKAEKVDLDLLAGMVVSLLTELVGKEIEKDQYTRACSELLETDLFTGFLAFDGSQNCIGVITVSETSSIYAGGRFGIIQELYVIPEYRSRTVGHELIQKALSFASERKWKRVEVGTPDPEKWNRTIEFYKKEGFVNVGTRMKLVLN